MEGLMVISDIMSEFGRVFGLCLNRDKSRVYFSKLCLLEEARATILGMDKEEFPFKYTGVPLLVNYARDINCQSLVEFAQ